MLLIVRRRKNNLLYRVTKYEQRKTKEVVLCKEWPGEHELGKDCDFIRLRKNEDRLIDFILDHLDYPIHKIAAECKVDYYVIYRLIQAFNIIVQKGRDKPKKKEGSFFDPSFACF